MVARLAWQPFSEKFGKIIKRFRRHLKQVERELILVDRDLIRDHVGHSQAFCEQDSSKFDSIENVLKGPPAVDPAGKRVKALTRLSSTDFRADH